MKMLLVLALGIAPLAVLTASSLFGRGPAITGAVLDDVKPVDLEEVADLAQAGADQAKKELALTQRLVDLEVFTDTPPALAIDGAGDRWKPIDKAWSDLKKAYDACSRLTKVYRLAPASAQAEHDALQAYLKSTPLASLSGGDELEVSLRRRIEMTSKRDLAAQTFAKLKQLMNATPPQYTRVLSEIDLINAEPLTDSEREALVQFRKKATFAVHWSKLPPLSESARYRSQALEELMQTTPPDADIEDRNLLSRMGSEIKQLKMQASIDELFAAEEISLRDLVEKSAAIVVENPTARPRLRDGLKAFLEARITVKQPPIFSNQLKEAWEKDGKYLRGVFRNPKPGATNTMYQFWGDPAAAKAGNPFERTIYLSELRSEPAKLTEVRVCEEFNASREKLLKNLDSRRTWEEFVKRCESIESKLSDYYTSGRSRVGRVSVAQERKVAAEVIDLWSHFSELFK